MLSQEVAWFDEPRNNSGTLSARLAVEAGAVQGVNNDLIFYILQSWNIQVDFCLKVTGIRVSVILQTLANFAIGIGIAFGHNWAIALLVIGFLPLIFASFAIQTKLLTGFSKKDREHLEEVGKVGKRFICFIIRRIKLFKELYY